MLMLISHHHLITLANCALRDLVNLQRNMQPCEQQDDATDT